MDTATSTRIMPATARIARAAGEVPLLGVALTVIVLAVLSMVATYSLTLGRQIGHSGNDEATFRVAAASGDRAGSAADSVAGSVLARPRQESLTPRMNTALGYAAARYRVSSAALLPIFAAAQMTGSDLGLDPLLIVAVIGIESSFNPLSESHMGAQGLMQVIPHYHKEKLPADADKLHLFDPIANIKVGALALREYIRSTGGVMDGLQQFAGARDDPTQSYAEKVLAEKKRLEGQRVDSQRDRQALNSPRADSPSPVSQQVDAPASLKRTDPGSASAAEPVKTVDIVESPAEAVVPITMGASRPAPRAEF